MEKVKTIEPDFYSVNSVLSKNKALCLCVSVFHSIFRKPILFYYKLVIPKPVRRDACRFFLHRTSLLVADI